MEGVIMLYSDILKQSYESAGIGGGSASVLRKTQTFTGDGSTTEFAVDGGFNVKYTEVYVNGVNVTTDNGVDISDGKNIKFNNAPNDGDEIYGVFYNSFKLTNNNSDMYFSDPNKGIIMLDRDETDSDGNPIQLRVAVKDATIGLDDVTNGGHINVVDMVNKLGTNGYKLNTEVLPIDDNSTNGIWSAVKVNNELTGKLGAGSIDDNSTADDKLWSSNKVNNELAGKLNVGSIDDGSTADDKLWSSNKVNDTINKVSASATLSEAKLWTIL
jgi:hypothetical protein